MAKKNSIMKVVFNRVVYMSHKTGDNELISQHCSLVSIYTVWNRTKPEKKLAGMYLRKLMHVKFTLKLKVIKK